MDGHKSRVGGEGVANNENSGWKSVQFRKMMVKQIVIAILKSWPRNVEYDASCAKALAKVLEQKVFDSAKDEADYNLKIRLRKKSLETSSHVHGPKSLATSSNPSGASSSSVVRVAEDWQEELYQRVQMLKSKWLKLVSTAYQHYMFKILPSQSITQAEIERSARIKKAIEEACAILNVSRSQIGPDFKSKLAAKEGIINFIVRKFGATSSHKEPHSTDKCSIQQAVPSQSRVIQDKLPDKPSMSLQISHSSEQIPNQNKMNPPVDSVKSDKENPEKLMQQVAVEYSSISQKHETPLSAVTSDQPTPAIQRLVKAVSSMSRESLRESVGEIRDIISLSDIMSAPYKRPRNVVDLSADSQARYSEFGYSLERDTNVRRCHEAMPLYTASLYANTSESLNPLTDAVESDFNSFKPQGKRPTDEEKHALLEEINEVKKLLLDTEVVMSEAGIIPIVSAGAAEQDDGLIVEFYFTGKTVSLDPMSNLVSNQMSIIKPLRLFVPTSYPIRSPILLDELPSESRDESDDLSTKAKVKLQVSLQSLAHPISIKNIAMSWEMCVREAICDYAHKLGGGTFSSKYGGWENV